MNKSIQAIILRYIASLGLNFLGIGIQGIVIPWLLLELTHSPTSVGGLLVLRGLVSTLLSPHAGSLSDRADRRSLSVKVNLVIGTAVVMFGCVLLFAKISTLLLFGITAIMSIGNAYFLPASMAHIQSLVDKQLYTKVASSREIAMQVGVIGGTLASGLLLQYLALPWVFAIIGLCFVASALSFSWLPVAQTKLPTQVRSQTGLVGNLKNMQVIFATSQLAVIIGLLMIPTLAMQIDNVLISGYVKQVLQEDAIGFSLINAAYSCGALLAGTALIGLASKLIPRIAVPLLFAGLGGAHLLFGTSGSLRVAIAAAFAIGITLVPVRILLNSALMTSAGNEFAGRAQAALQMAAALAVILVGLLAGASASAFGYFVSFAFVLVICLIGAGLYLWYGSGKSVRKRQTNP